MKLPASVIAHIEATHPQLTTPKSWDDLEVGQVVKVGGNRGPNEMLFRVTQLLPGQAVITLVAKPEKGRRWMLTQLDTKGFVAYIGDIHAKVIGKGGDYLRVKPL